MNGEGVVCKALVIKRRTVARSLRWPMQLHAVLQGTSEEHLTWSTWWNPEFCCHGRCANWGLCIHVLPFVGSTPSENGE